MNPGGATRTYNRLTDADPATVNLAGWVLVHYPRTYYRPGSPAVATYPRDLVSRHPITSGPFRSRGLGARSYWGEYP